MGRHAETKLFKSQKLNSPNGKNWCMIQGRPTGKRERYYFATEKQAKKAAADRNRQLTAFGSQTALPEAERVMAAECIKMLAPFGKTLYDATRFYRDFLREESSSISVTKLCEIIGEEFERRLSNGGATLRHKRTMDSCLKKFEARFGASPIKTLTGAEIKEWLSALPDTKVKTQNNLLGYIRNVYGIALEKELISEDPFQYVKSFPQSEKFEKEPTPLTPEEAERLLNAAEPSVLPFIAIGLFAGLRTAERDELDWRDIHITGPEPEIDLEKKISKTGRRRSVPIQPALKAFLEPYVRPEGRIIPLTCNGLVAYQNAWERSVKKAGLWPWPENALRDSFVSYRYKATGSSETTSQEAGHSVGIMFAKYQKRISKEATEQFWNLRPR
jgi:integrase